ncbi:MAG: HAD-IA family hydrolase [Propionibacteriaceae bacterium]|jgi:pyrophosphatase PpaX|nr:HAD-IA family hydrolase [Propionibacteriaceae bacterium]
MAPRWPVVIFDIDGTLVNSVDLIVASYQHAFQTVLGHEWDETEILTWLGQSLIGAFQRRWPDQADALYRAYTDWNHAHTEELLAEYPGVLELTKDLVKAGVRVAAATSKRRDQAQWALDLARLGTVVPLIVTHEDVDEHKPSPKPLLLAARRLECPPAQAVYVGDAVVDIEAARAAGMACVAVTWGAGVREALAAQHPAWLVDTVDRLRDVLLPG